MVSLARYFPLPFACGQLAYVEGATNAHGNPADEWVDAQERDCFWWDPSSAEIPTPPTAGTRVLADRVLVLDSSVPVDHRDKFVVDGDEFTVEGKGKDYNHGPFGFSPNRIVVELKRVG